MLGSMRRLARSDQGAIAPLTALSLFALIAVGGIAFDYARLASMDTELQQAADQAALAAATQLDGNDRAIERAEAAGAGAVTNQTLFANDGGGNDVGALTFTFYTGYDNATDTFGAVTTDDEDARVVRVAVGGREAFYSLTPVVAAFSSGSIEAEAVASMAAAVCKVPPLMICNPNPGGDPDFEGNYTGHGFLLVARNNHTETYGPGNFGFLDTGYDTTGGAAALRRALGQQNFLQNCIANDTVVTEPGASSPALDALNTRFDIYSSNVSQNQVCGLGQCPPSTNVRKDVMRDHQGNAGNGIIKNSCKPSNEDTGQKGWKLPPDATKRYHPTSPTVPLTAAQRNVLYPMGHPRDMCHAVSAAGSCGTPNGGRLGTGVWDRAAYFQSNYGAAFDWQNAAGLGPNVTRYQTYLWELTNQLNASPAGYGRDFTIGGPSGGKLHNQPVCQTTGAVTPTADIDRRRLTVAVVNCTGANSASGKKTLEPTKWIDIFLVEPSWDRRDGSGTVRTTPNDMYIEIIGEASITGAGGVTYQVERSVPYLIR